MKKIIEKTTFAGSRQRRQTKMIALSCVMSLLMFTVYSCNKFNNQISETINVSFTPCQQKELKSSSNFSGNVNVEFTNNGVQITYSNFAVTCDFTNVNVTHTLVNGVLNITQAGTPNLANCICYTDVSYTINGILQNEVNVIFINGEQVYCYNDSETGEVPYVACPCEEEKPFANLSFPQGEAYFFKDSIPWQMGYQIWSALNNCDTVYWIVFDSNTNKAELTMGWGSLRNICKICNFPNFAKEWDITQNGCKVDFEGITYKSCVEPSIIIATDAYFDYILTYLKRK